MNKKRWRVPVPSIGADLHIGQALFGVISLTVSEAVDAHPTVYGLTEHEPARGSKWSSRINSRKKLALEAV